MTLTPAGVKMADTASTKIEEGTAVASKDKGGSKTNKKAPQHNLKEKRQAKKAKKAR